MIKSMTGLAKLRQCWTETFSVDIRALNSKQLDVNVNSVILEGRKRNKYWQLNWSVVKST
ncbi:MAG: YicC/YloC family endoribonuclease [Bacteroidia bacterium]